MTTAERLDKLERDVATGEIFRVTRFGYGYSMMEMSALLGISKSMLSLIENGQRKVTKDILKRYLDVFKVEQSEFEKTQEKVLALQKKRAGIDIMYVIVKMLKKK